MLENIQIGFDTAVTSQNLLYCFIGVTLGTFFGVLPGIGALASVSMLLPLALYLPPATALIMLAGVYYGAEYGGSISSILLNLPGTPSNAVTCLDGYPLALKGKAGLALFVTTISSYIGGTIGILALFLLSPLITSVALEFGPSEFFCCDFVWIDCCCNCDGWFSIKRLIDGFNRFDAWNGWSRFGDWCFKICFWPRSSRRWSKFYSIGNWIIWSFRDHDVNTKFKD